VVIDIDHNGVDKFGEDTMAKLVAEHGPWPEAPTVLTPSGGRHLYGRWPGVPLRGKLGDWVDVQGDGKQVVAPISARNGKRYLWEQSLRPSLVPPPDLPGWALELLVLSEPETAEGPDEFAELLTAAGFTLTRVDNKGNRHWTRPGKDPRQGWSLTVYPWPDHHAVVWSESVPGVETGRPYGPKELARLLGVDGDEERAKAKPATKVSYIKLVEVKSMQQTWLWKDHLPAGQLVIVAGREKLGKSTAMVWVCARLTKGELPGNAAGRPINVLLVSAEDDAARQLKPRAVAAGADMTRFFVLDPGGPGFVMDTVKDVRPELVVLDPFSVFIHLASSDNEHGEVAIRQSLEPFNALIAELGATVAGIRHLRKSDPGDNPFDAVLGSKAWAAAARALLFFTPDPEHPERPGGLIFPRGNLAKPGAGSRYRLDPTWVKLDDGNVGEYPLFVLEEGDVGIDLDEALGPQEEAAGRLRAERFLKDFLTEHGRSALASEVLAAAKDEDIPEKALRRAKTSLGVVSDRDGFGPGSVVTWRLP
jgi:AAA domain/Bifunctional DNA primase/polymerase, N-terminal